MSKELKIKLDDLKSKIDKIQKLGGIVPDAMFLDLKNVEEQIKNKQNSDMSELHNLQKKFKNELDTIRPTLEKMADEAYQILDKACFLSEKTGIPFSSPVRIMGDDYIPNTFFSKWRDPMRDMIEDSFCDDEFEEAHDNLNDYFNDNNIYFGDENGWQQSRIC